MKYIVFKNNRALYRQEKFGGIVYYKSRVFLLNHFEFEFIESFNNYKQIDQLNPDEIKLVEKLLKWQIFMKIDSVRANEIKEKRQTSSVPNRVARPASNH